MLLYRNIKEVELRSRRAQFVMTEITIELVYTHAPSRLPVKTLRRLFTQKKKSKGTGMEGGLEKYHFCYSFAFSSQLINNHDAKVHAPIASCSLILATVSLAPRRWILKSLFWPENAITVAILLQVLAVAARMFLWRKQVIKCWKFYHFAIGRGRNWLKKTGTCHKSELAGRTGPINWNDTSQFPFHELQFIITTEVSKRQ